MSIPNTTQTPNIIFNGLMKEMTDTELRVVLVVIRATYGWIADRETGMRKEEDWISHYQLKEKTGRQSGALSNAIDSCIQKGWIEARDSKGNLLNTKGKRKGKNIYYRIGKKIMITTSSESEKVRVTSSETANAETANAETEDYKRNSYTKETLNKTGLAKPTKRKDIEFSKEDYKKVVSAYENLKGIKPQGGEYLPIQQTIKTMFMSGRTPEQIISCMEWFADSEAEIWEQWNIKTVKLKLPEFLSGKLKG